MGWNDRLGHTLKCRKCEKLYLVPHTVADECFDDDFDHEYYHKCGEVSVFEDYLVRRGYMNGKNKHG